MRKLRIQDYIGVAVPILAALFFLMLTALGELSIISHPLILAFVASLVCSIATVLFGTLGLAFTSLCLLGIAFVSGQSTDHPIFLAFALPAMAGVMALASVMIRRWWVGFRKRQQVSVGNEVVKLRERIEELEALTRAGSGADLLAASATLWLDELERLTEAATSLLVALPESERTDQHAEAFAQSLKELKRGFEAQRLMVETLASDPVAKESTFDVVVRRALENVDALVKESNTEVELNLQKAGILSVIDEELVIRALTNLLTNAIEASGQGNKITITTSSDYRSTEGMIEIVDRGAGISNDVISEIFKPYFSTRPRHLGLGLASTKEILRRHGGSIAVSHNELRGVTFRVRLPIKRSTVDSSVETPKTVLTPAKPEEVKAESDGLSIEEAQKMLADAKAIQAYRQKALGSEVLEE